jgi:RNA polymerase sigma factor (sigma-70 family)
MSDSRPTPVAANDPEQLLADRAWLVRIATILLGDRDEAEDLAQEAQMRALASPPRAGGERPWLRRVAQNLASRWRLRREWRAQWERRAARPEREPSSGELVARVQAQRAVADAVLKLAEPDREVVLLRFFDDLPPAQIAARLKLPVETVRTRLKRALARLRERLDAAHGGREAWSALLAPWMGVATMQSAAKVAIAAGIVVAMSLVVQQTVAWRERVNAAVARDVSAPVASGETTVSMDSSDATPAPVVAPAAQRDLERAEPGSRAVVRMRATGRVIDSATRAPLPGACIACVRHLDDDLPPALAAGDGRFTFEWPASEGRHVALIVTERDHAPLLKDRMLPEPTVEGDVATLALGDLALEAGVVVRGRVVHLPERGPVADAELFVLAGWPTRALRGEWGHLRPQGRTDGNGRFELAEHVATQREAVVLFARTETAVGFAPLALLPGRALLDDVEIDVEPTGELLAVVTDGDGAPVAGATVQARPLFAPLDEANYGGRDTLEPLALDAGWRRLFEATTDADGVARLPFLPEGRSDPAWEQYAGHMQSYLALAKRAGGGLLRAPFLLKRGETTRIELSANRRAPAGEKRSIVLRGRVTDDAGEPIPDATVHVGAAVAVQSDEAGLYETAAFELRGEQLVVEVAAAGFVRQTVRRKRTELVASAGAATSGTGEAPHDELGLDVVLQRGFAIRGVVVDESNRPVEHVGVRISRQDDSGRSEVAAPTRGATGPDGGFAFEGVASGDWLLEAYGATGFRYARSRHVTAGDEAVIVHLVHEWPAHARLVADVVDATSGEPLDPTEANVSRVGHADGSGPGSTLSLGSVVVDRLFPGRWEIELRVKQGGRLRKTFDITAPEQELHLTLAVAAAGEILGHVRWPEGRRPQYAGVFVMPGDACHAVDGGGRPLGDVTDGYAPLGADDRFHFKEVLPDTPLFLSLAGGDSFAEATVVVASGEAKEVELVPVTSPRLAWRIAGALPPGIAVLSTSRDGELWSDVAWCFSPARDALLTEQRFMPGPLRWRVRFTSDEAADPTTATTQVEGRLAVEAASDVTITVAGLH